MELIAEAIKIMRVGENEGWRFVFYSSHLLAYSYHHNSLVLNICPCNRKTNVQCQRSSYLLIRYVDRAEHLWNLQSVLLTDQRLK